MSGLVRVNDEAVRAALRAAPAIAVREIKGSLTRSAVFTQRQYRQNMPVGATAELRRSVGFRFLNHLTVKVEPTAEHADFVEKGTRPHWTSVRNLERWARMKGLNPYAVQRSIARKGTKAHPFQQKTARQAEAFAIRDIDRTIDKLAKGILR